MAKPKDYTITITNGKPDPSPLQVSPANKDTVTFEDGGGGPWYIVFDPFSKHVLSTSDAGNSKLKLHGQPLGNCSYLVLGSDPSIRSKKKKKKDGRGFTAAGGGIIIDN